MTSKYLKMKQNVYSKTYRKDQNETLVVDNVKYHLANNKKSMVKVGSRQLNKVNNNLSTLVAKSSIINKHRILRENNHQYTQYRSTINFKRANKSKFKLILRKPANKFTKSSNLYKKIYNNVPKKNDLIKNQIQQIRKKAVKSSINCLLKKSSSLKKNNKLKLTTINTTYCMFFCRFGKCANIDTCKYKHDKEKVAVCKNFLRGKCDSNACLLSHKVDPKKMPVCSFYLKGICNIDNCPYRHVNVNENAKTCRDFLRGFCDKGDQVSI